MSALAIYRSSNRSIQNQKATNFEDTRFHGLKGALAIPIDELLAAYIEA